MERAGLLRPGPKPAQVRPGGGNGTAWRTVSRPRREIATLPGIGRSTAAAISAFSNGESVAILDGNVKRVLCRVFGIDGFPRRQERREPALGAGRKGPAAERDIGTYIQAQMDLGATVCSRAEPACGRCPVATLCRRRRDNRIGELPSARPRKAVRKRSARFAVIPSPAMRYCSSVARRAVSGAACWRCPRSRKTTTRRAGPRNAMVSPLSGTVRSLGSGTHSPTYAEIRPCC